MNDVPTLKQIETGKINTDLEAAGFNRTKALAVVALKIAGASFDTIAKDQGYSSALAARQAYERILAETVDEEKDLPRARQLQNARLSRLLQSTWRKAIDDKHADHLAYVRTALAIIDRQNKMNGWDTPTQVNVAVTPQMEQIEAWAARMAAEVTGEEIVIEADLFDEHDDPVHQ